MVELKIIFLLLNAGVQVTLVILLAIAVRRTRETAEESGRATVSNQEILDLNQRQRQVLGEQIALSQKALEEHFRPTLVGFLERQSERESIDLVFIIRNIGRGVAEITSVQFPEESTAHDESPWNVLQTLTSEINSLPPGYQFLCPLARAGKYINGSFDYPISVELTISYRDSVTKSEYQNTFCLNLAAPTGLCRQ